MGRFVEALATAIAGDVNPARANAATRTTRAWTDLNRDFIAQESELGPSSNTNFGTSNVGIRYDPELITGWGKRAFNWEWSAGVQHQLYPGLSMEAGYFRRTRGNFRVTDNLRVAPADFDPYCVTTPLDPRLPGGGGTSLCGLYNVKPALFGLNDNVITSAENFGKRSEAFDGVDLTVNMRLPGRTTLQGGTSTGRIKTGNCSVVDSPEQLLNCSVTPPFLTQFKLQGTYPLPWWGLRTSATYQSLPGPEITAAWAAPAAAVTGLGRALAGNVRTVAVPLVRPGTLYGERLHQIDMRIIKELRLRSFSVQPQFDIYNVLNATVAIRQNNTYGASWQDPTALLGGRLGKLSVRIAF